MYGCIYLAGNWDPYGRLDNVPVAVVNEDVPTTVNGGDVHAGRDFVDSLHRDAKFDFRDTDAADAEAGLREGRYYLVISVPPTFSSDLVSGQTDDPTRARIMLRRNDANGFVIGTITNSAQDSIAKAIDETAVSSYFEAVFASLDTIRDAMASAADGAAQLDTGLATAHDGSARLRSGASDAAAGADALATGATELAAGAATASDGAASLAEGMTTLDEGAARLKDGSRQVADGTAQLADTLDPVLTLAAERLPTVQADVTKAADAASELTAQIAEGGGTIAGAGADISRSLDDLLATNPSLADDPAFTRLRSGAERLSSATGAAAQGQGTSLTPSTGPTRPSVAPATSRHGPPRRRRRWTSSTAALSRLPTARPTSAPGCRRHSRVRSRWMEGSATSPPAPTRCRTGRVPLPPASTRSRRDR
nr:YhgE/Pip domain-containing protein [Tessaracoccus coleopterorum]